MEKTTSLIEGFKTPGKGIGSAKGFGFESVFLLISLFDTIGADLFSSDTFQDVRLSLMNELNSIKQSWRFVFIS